MSCAPTVARRRTSAKKRILRTNGGRLTRAHAQEQCGCDAPLNRQSSHPETARSYDARVTGSRSCNRLFVCWIAWNRPAGTAARHHEVLRGELDQKTLQVMRGTMPRHLPERAPTGVDLPFRRLAEAALQKSVERELVARRDVLFLHRCGS